MAGTLFVVATPIGNLEDLSFRALRTLKEVDLIAAEDTRRTAKLLAHYEIRKPMVSLREHNERRETPRLVERLKNGGSIALVSDAGTPGISDPGHHLVRSAREAGIAVSPIPGPSAVMAALSASGEPADEFVFHGFVPRSGALRNRWLTALLSDPRTQVFFEAPHRIERLTTELRQLLVNRPIHIFREISKINESYVIQSNQLPDSELKAIGEFVIVVGKSLQDNDNTPYDPTVIDEAVRVLDCLTNNNSFSAEDGLRLASAATSVAESDIRKAAKKARIARKRVEESLS